MIGRTIGHYRIVDRLGEGGMGVVYRAEDTKLGRSVALKFLPPEVSRDAEAKSRFEREARAASLLDHPNICTIYGFGEAEGGQLYIAMACYDGESLAARIAREVLPLDEAIRIVEQIARGLGKAHASGIVHRDIKPANVMLTSDGVAKILDFGLAKLSGATGITRSNTSLGTIVYMSPEQIRGEEVGPQADIWALGVVLFELLTGKRPFRGEYSEAISYAILNEQPVTITDLRADLPAGLDQIIKRMLRKDPLQRYQSVDEVLEDLAPLRTPSSGSEGRKRTTERQKLRPGSKLGPYVIEKPLGSGGMGDVYLAKDTRLERQVAIKVLPPEFSEDAQLKQRFQREAKTISQLNHPNICTLFDVGEQEGLDFLVMEYLEGETLAEKKGPLSIAQVLKIGIQIAEGLAAAHRQGIVHRDLKPGNVMITRAGTVKLVDFGLAKEVGAIAMKTRQTRGSDEKPLTAEGTIVGTLAYMAPEQIARGEADARTDIFALGAMLYEMVTGKRAFAGETKASLIASIIERDPVPIRSLQPAVPSTLERIIRRCLEKDPEKRWQSTGDLAVAIAWIDDEQTIGARSRFSRTAVWSAWIAANLIIAAAVVAVLLLRPGKPDIGNRYNLDPPAGVRLLPDEATNTLAISNDGRWVAFSGVSSEDRALYVRAIDRVDVRRLAGTEGGSNPFFSPDGKWLGFHEGDTIRKVPVSGGEPVPICRASRVRGASWGDDGTIVFSTGDGLRQVPANGGEPKILTKPPPGERHNWPQHLPDGRTILFSVLNSLNETALKIAVLSLDTGRIQVLRTGGSYPRYEPRSGNLIYCRLGTLYAVPFNPRKLEISGEPRAVLDDVSFYQGSYSVKFAVSRNGSAVYVSGAPRIRQGELVSTDRQGKITSLSEKRRGYYTPVPSPDGRQLAAILWGPTIEDADVWVRDRGDSWTRLTREGHSVSPIVWSADGQWLVYTSHFTGHPKLFRVRSDGSGQPEQLTTGTDWDFAWSFSPDGKRIAFSRQAEAGGPDLFTMPVEGDRAPQPFLAAPDFEFDPAFSPDGRWIAYFSNASNRNEIYVRPYPGPGAAVKVSTEGGWNPRWNRNGKELFYVAAGEDEVWVASVNAASEFSAGTPRRLFKLESVDCCSVSSDGQQFFGVRYPKQDDQEHHLVYIPNFSDELKQGRGTGR